MDCTEAQESILESLISPVTDEQRLRLTRHIAACLSCRGFQEVQREIDKRLTEALPSTGLSAGWRDSLKRKVRGDPLSAWPDFLPDVAHLIGCAIGITLSLELVPWHPRTILLAGITFTVFTYILQAVLRSYIERPADI
jgi:hypothetical protein